MYNTKNFESKKLVKGYIKHIVCCEYCGKECIQDEEWDEYTKYTYNYCDCKKAKAEIKMKSELNRLKEDYEENRDRILSKYKAYSRGLL